MESLSWKEVVPDVYIIWNSPSEGVVYSPLHGIMFSANREGMDIIDNYLEGGGDHNHPFHTVLRDRGILESVDQPMGSPMHPFSTWDVMLSISEECNLRCIYCYASGGESHLVLPWESITQTIRYLFRFADQYDNEIEICFHGTGEALVRWETLVKIVDYALSICPSDVDVVFSLVTNGTLIDEERARFLAAHDFFVSVSMDGLQVVQDLQRPKADGTGSFEAVVRGLSNMKVAGVRFMMRCTITGSNVTEIPDFVAFCAEMGAQKVAVVPFSAVGRGVSGVESLDPEVFIRSYLCAVPVAEGVGIEFLMPGAELEKVRARFCRADGSNFAVMPDGGVSCCSRVTRREDALADPFYIGHVHGLGVTIDQSRVDTLRKLNVRSWEQCEGCFARFNCAGGCPHDRLLFGSIPEEYCRIVRTVLWYQLLDAVENL